MTTSKYGYHFSNKICNWDVLWTKLLRVVSHRFFSLVAVIDRHNKRRVKVYRRIPCNHLYRAVLDIIYTFHCIDSPIQTRIVNSCDWWRRTVGANFTTLYISDGEIRIIFGQPTDVQIDLCMTAMHLLIKFAFKEIVDTSSLL